MTSLTENKIEQFALRVLERFGYDYLYGPNIAQDGDHSERSSYESVLLEERVAAAIRRLNPSISPANQEEALKMLHRLNSPDLIRNNLEFHLMLTEGIYVTEKKDGEPRGDYVWLIDFDEPNNNDFHVVNQFTVTENGVTKRPDLVLFVNGLPLVVVELKNAADENATVRSAFRQIKTYQDTIPGLFTYNAFSVISDGLEAKAGTISAGFTRFMAWKSADGETEASRLVGQLETLIQGMLNRDTLLDLIRHFIVFEETKKEDPETEIITIHTVKKLAAYHQYYAVNLAFKSTLRAGGYDVPENLLSARELPSKPSKTDTQPAGDRKGGVVWHTQGSGKSLSMVFFTGKIVLALENPTIVIITDRNDLDDQLFDTFSASRQLLRQPAQQVESRDDLKEKLKVASGGIVFTTIQKFYPAEGNQFDLLTDRKNVVVIADEAHRTQYGFKAKTRDEKDEAGNVVGKKVVYGFAKYMHDALPEATYVGFTGTPIESTDVNTPAVFGNYIDIYDIAQAVEDGATVQIFYESRLAKVYLSEEGKKLVAELDTELEKEDLTESQKAKAKWTRLEALVGSQERIKNVARDVVQHFELRQEAFEGKGMVVAMSRRIAAKLYKEIIALRPEWHSGDLKKGAIKVVMTASSSEGTLISRHHTTKKQRRMLAERMKDEDDELKLVIVRDMWLTGFDAPSLHTMYIDKPMRGHNLMQAIARVNRVFKDKPGGLVVDYLGIASDLKSALNFYSDSGGKGDPALVQLEAVRVMHEKLEVVSQMFDGFPYEEYFAADTRGKLNLILEAEEHVLGLENGKRRYVNQVMALSKAFALATPHEDALDAKDEIAFFQAVKARLAKFDATGSGRSDEELETTIRQVIDQALVSEEVVDIFDAAGIKKPNISILSEEFLKELQGMKRKNVALEVLKKLLTDEIRARSKTNLVKSRSFKEMLEAAIRKYQNKVLTAAEVIEELIRLSQEIVEMDNEAQKLGLTDFEYAFYSAVASNESAQQLMEQDKLRELAVILTERVRKNASIDWTIKESVRAKLKVVIKRTLRQYGYPPDMRKLATETVLKQAERIAEELTRE